MVARDQGARGARGARPEDPLYEEIRSELRTAVALLEQGRVLLLLALNRLPPGEFAPETDEPLDLPAAWRGLVDATVSDELAAAIEAIEHASRLTPDPATWYRRG